MNTEILNETEATIDLDEVVALTEYLGEALHMHPGAELALTLVDPTTMEDLHIKWMDLEGPTDVMSFPMDQLHQGREGELSEGSMGDIIICPEVAAAQAAAAGHSTMDEVLLLTVHGFLHLLGYDHHDPEERAEMFALQRHLLLTFFAARYDGRTDIPTPTEV